MRVAICILLMAVCALAQTQPIQAVQPKVAAVSQTQPVQPAQPKMAAISLTVSDGVSTMVKAVADVTVAFVNLATVTRETMSPQARDEQDHITAQAYWDWRNVLKTLGLVGEPIPWPPALAPAK
jgi:hypothetical protein